MTSFQSNVAARSKAVAAAKQPTEPPSPDKPRDLGPGGVEMPSLLKPLQIKTGMGMKEDHQNNATFFNEEPLGGAATSLAPEALDMVKDEIFIQIDAMQSEI